MKAIIVTGGFDPLHSGHIAYFKAAKALGDDEESILIVGLNSDEWLARKKGRSFMPWEERASIIRELECVDDVIAFDDYDGSAVDCIYKVGDKYPYHDIVFANGGDRDHNNIPEADATTQDVTFAFGVGGKRKANSSSWILDNWKAPKTKRDWGYYRVIHEVQGTKVKELTVEPGQRLSMQKHAKRNEYWLVTEGACEVLSQTEGGYQLPVVRLEKHDEYTIICGDWHQLYNPYDNPCRIVEIQYGEYCKEDDIERK